LPGRAQRRHRVHRRQSPHRELQPHDRAGARPAHRRRHGRAAEGTSARPARTAMLRQATMLVRHLLSIALLPFVVVVLVPRWLLASPAPAVRLPSDLLVSGRIVGALLFAAGFALFLWCVLLFAR